MSLEDELRAAIRVRQYSYRTEESYVQWYRRYVRFHRLRHPAEMGEKEIEEFLSDLAGAGRVSRGTQNQAFNALMFLYRQVERVRSAQALRGQRVRCAGWEAERLGL